MDYKLGNNKKIKDIGKTNNIECPKCGKKVHFSVFSNANIDVVPSLPIIKSSNVYFLVCPSCAEIFTVDEKIGDEFKNGKTLVIGNYDLKNLSKFKQDV